jgi:hypothetical protein
MAFNRFKTIEQLLIKYPLKSISEPARLFGLLDYVFEACERQVVPQWADTSSS